MLNTGDIEFMKESQDEIYELRCRPITFFYVTTEYDEESGIEIGETEKDIEADAVITEISMRKGDGSRFYEGGIEYEKGDIKIDVKLDYLDGKERELIRAEFDDVEYEILAGDKKGIGIRNRIEYLGREIS